MTQLHQYPELEHALGSLLSGLELLGEARAVKTVLITSTKPLEGKTTVALNLAIAAASFTRKRVLLVDGDLRRPSLHECLGQPSGPGFADLLRKDSVDDTAVLNVQLPKSNGWDASIGFIPSGAADDDLLSTLNKAHVRSVLARVGKSYDLVVLDSPPMLAANDAAILATAVDGILFVVSAGDVDTRNAVLARGRLEQSGTSILGVVLNRFVEAAHGAGSHPYRHYHRDMKHKGNGAS